MANAEQITVEVSYARPDEQVIVQLCIDQDATLKQAILESGVLERFPEINFEFNKVGVFGKLKQLDQSLKHGDRVEIYRPLIVDPKEVRRRHVLANK